MCNITQQNLEAAFIDQTAAGAFRGKAYAFIPVVAVDGPGFELGIAVANEPGYSPIKGKSFPDWDTASEWADGLNQHLGLTADQTWAIVCSTMGGRPFREG